MDPESGSELTGSSRTDRQRSEEALRESEERYRSVVASLSEGIVAQAASGEITACNAAAERILGLTRDEMMGRTSMDPRWEAIHEDGTPFPGDTHPAMVTLRTGEPLRGVIMGVRKPSRELTWISINTQPIFGPDDDKPTAVVASFADITDQRRVEEERRRAHKLEAVGRLAGGVAHDFNNLLTAIMGHGELALRHLESDHAAAMNVRMILETAERASQLTSKLLTFGRGRVESPKAIDLHRLIREMENMLRRLVAEHIEIGIELAPGCGWIEADPTEIEQVLVNLVVNASDAMPQGGKLSIATAAAVDEGRDYVLLLVRDTGKGIPEDLREKIFEPFFTTKNEGRGTGLGLATSHAVVTRIGGHLRFQSEPGRGTTFEVYLPRREPDGLEEAATGAREGRDDTRGTETVLLVEDDPVLRDVLLAALEQQGYRVVEAADGNEALARAEEMEEGELDLLLTDGIMPGMSGRELAERLSVIRPGLRMMIMSGHVGDTLQSIADLPPGAVFLEKPFSPSALLERIREVLEGDGGRTRPTVP